MNRLVKRLLLGAALATLPVAGYEIPFGEGTAAGESDFYLVPNGYGRLVLKYASIPCIDFEGDPGSPNGPWQSPGNIATALAEGSGVINVRHREFLNAGEAALVFKQGRLAMVKRDGNESQRQKDISALSTHPKKLPTLLQLWRRRTAEQEERSRSSWWRHDSRLHLGYFNPNAAGTLFAELAALFVALAIVLRRRGFRIACLLAMAFALVGVFLTGSRGSFVAWGVGLAAVVVCHFGRRLIHKKTLAVIATAVVLGLGALFAVSSLTNGRFGTNLMAMDAGNVQRLRSWSAAPEMMATAPDGWGYEPGRAYCDWFQSTDDNHPLLYLVNSHLTWMVQHGRLFRCAYVAAWLALFAFLLTFFRDRIAQVAIAVWSTFSVALWFSTVGIFPTLWIIPALCGSAVLALVARSLARNVVDCKTVVRRVALLVCVVLVGCAVPFALEAVGRHQAVGRAHPVCFDGSVVRLGQGDAQLAILRDSTVLAGDAVGCLGHELRDWMSRNPDAGAVLVADDPADLPPTVECLVAAGKGAARYLKFRNAHLADGSFCRARRTIFLSPPFPPSAVPYTFQQGTDLQIVIGEFAAQYEEAYSRSSPWVTIVPNSELYIPGWPELLLAQRRGGG